MDIRTAEIWVILGCSLSPHLMEVPSSIRRGEDGLKGADKEGYVILASWKDHFIKVGENVVQNPSNYISTVRN